MKCLMLLTMILSLTLINCAYNMEGSRAQLEYSKNRKCQTVWTRVSRWDDKHKVYRTVGYDSTKICQ